MWLHNRTPYISAIKSTLTLSSCSTVEWNEPHLSRRLTCCSFGPTHNLLKYKRGGELPDRQKEKVGSYEEHFMVVITDPKATADAVTLDVT